jgi:DNA-binding response OmpR family regulator
MATATAVLVSTPTLPLRRILLIGQGRLVQKSLQRLFHQEGFGVDVALSGAAGLEILETVSPSLILLDVHLGDISGRDLLLRIRQLSPSIPALVLGEKASVGEKVLFLELGADDYVCKPFSEPELLARVRAALRRASQPKSAHIFAFADVTVDTSRMEVMRAGRPVLMTPMEFNFLKFLIQNPERVIPREELLNAVWGYQNYPTTRTVDNHMCKLRQKLEKDPDHPEQFLTVHRVGYKFVP